ncbi:MAG: MoaD/ThiS family protein [Thermodesulfobacteriota bacterium]|nr:MoaD/ThiS family protein [Thermodesulfobacteriota bacterium]
MTFTQSSPTVSVRVFGFLQAYMDKQGLPCVFEKEIPRRGRTAYDIACELQIPPEEIEGIFLNGSVKNIYDPVFPGDRVAFFPKGTPGPYRIFLGIARENVERVRREKGKESRKHQQ